MNKKGYHQIQHLGKNYDSVILSKLASIKSFKKISLIFMQDSGIH